MAESTTDRLGLPRWTAASDTLNRAELDGAMASLEGVAAGFLHGLAADRPTASAPLDRFAYYSRDGGPDEDGALHLCVDTTGSGGWAWVEVPVGGIDLSGYATADHDHATLPTVSATAPAEPAADDLWYDASAEVLKRWTGTAWVAEGSAAYEAKVDRTGATAGEVPTLQADGTLAFESGSSASETVWLANTDFEINAGSPSRDLGLFGGWLLDADVLEAISHLGKVPAGWGTYDVDVYWATKGAADGDVTFRCTISDAPPDAGLTTGDDFAATVAAAGNNVVSVTTLVTGRAAPASADTVVAIAVQRRAADASDTQTTDIRFMGVLLRKAS